MKHMRPIVAVGICLPLLLLGGTIAPSATAADFPKKAITWLVPYTPGGGFDTYSRAIAKFMPKYLPKKVPVVVKNMPGAGGRRASAVLYRSKPNGYTIGILNPQGLAASDIVKKATEYDLMKFTYLGTCSRDVGGLYVGGQSPFKTVEDLQKQKDVKFATGGRGSTTWLWGVLVKGVMNVPVSFVSGYSGTSGYTTAVIRGDADAMAYASSTSVLSYVKAGELKTLMIFTRAPWDLLPEAPTAKGTPYEELADLVQDRVVAAPPGLPKNLAGVLEDALMKSLNDKELQAWSKKVNRPLYIASGADTLNTITKVVKILEKYKDVFRE